MSVEKLIVKYGKQTVWQNPSRDRQSRIQLTRISPKNGYRVYGKVAREIVETPREEGYYHFYQIGDNYTGQFGLFSKKNQWYKLSDWCNVSNLVVHVYTKNGKMFPAGETYVIRLYNDNIVVGVLINDKIDDLNKEELYIHFYNNFYYRNPNVKSENIINENQVRYGCYTVPENLDKSFFSALVVLKSRSERGEGKLLTFLNGNLVDRVITNELEIGDVVEYYYDKSFRAHYNFPVNSLRTFKSTLDSLNKYILHPKRDEFQDYVAYRDDIDIYVYQVRNKNDPKYDPKSEGMKGLYYHHNNENAVRMLTHRDYSVPVPYVMHLIEQLEGSPKLSEFRIRVYVRDNGPRETYTNSASDIKALYQLPDNKIVGAMATVNSNLKEWTADSLESSAYTALMRSFSDEITPALSLDALGYNSSASLLAEPNHLIKNTENGSFFLIPEGLLRSSTIFEYNSAGLLLGWYHHKDYLKYYPRNSNCVYIEALSGEGGDDITYHTGSGPFPLLENTAYRFYKARVVNNQKTGNFVDVTSSIEVLINEDDYSTFELKYDNVRDIAVAVGDDKFLCYEQLINLSDDGVMDFNVTYGRDRINTLTIPPGKLDIWLNGHSLVENIDYFVDWPRVTIVTKAYIQNNSNQHITVRCMGFPFTEDGALKRNLPSDTGFTKYGKISANARYNSYEDKIIRANIDGGVFHPSVVNFDEYGDADVGRFVQDGKPYSIEIPYISLRGTLGVSLYNSQILDHDLNRRVTDYLTYHLPKEARENPPILDKHKYRVYSPFLSRIAMDLKYGRLKSPLPNVSPQVIDQIIKDYKYILTMDPIVRGFDEYFVSIHAHPFDDFVVLTARDIAFLEKLNELYLKSTLDISTFFTVRK